MISDTPDPPYYAVIFSSVRTEAEDGYFEMSQRMIALAQQQDGFLGVESARNDIGLTVSYWLDLESIKRWREHSEHVIAQNKGRGVWYKSFKVRIAKIERDYGSTNHHSATK